MMRHLTINHIVKMMNKINKLVLFSLFITLALPSVSYSGGVATRICIENKSAHSYLITGTDVDSYDWEDVHDDGAMNRPDYNWVNYKLDPGEVKCQPEDVNIWENAKYFTFKVVDSQNPKIEAKTMMKNSSDKVGQNPEPGVNYGKWLAQFEGSSSRAAPGRLIGLIHDGKGGERSECIHTHLIDGYQKYCSLFYINH